MCEEMFKDDVEQEMAEKVYAKERFNNNIDDSGGDSMSIGLDLKQLQKKSLFVYDPEKDSPTKLKKVKSSVINSNNNEINEDKEVSCSSSKGPSLKRSVSKSKSISKDGGGNTVKNNIVAHNNLYDNSINNVNQIAYQNVQNQCYQFQTMTTFNPNFNMYKDY